MFMASKYKTKLFVRIQNLRIRAFIIADASVCVCVCLQDNRTSCTVNVLEIKRKIVGFGLHSEYITGIKHTIALSVCALMRNRLGNLCSNAMCVTWFVFVSIISFVLKKERKKNTEIHAQYAN